MLAPTGRQIDYDDLVRDDRVHGSLYYDEAIFKEELDKIWYRQWVFIGHESMVPNPGDYRTERIGLQPIIIVRDSQHRVRVYYNRCRHRANTLCEQRQGNSMTLMCCYHGWTYSIDGQLQGVPFIEDYGPDFDKKDYPLVEVARVDSYRGLLFANLSPDGPDLKEHLGFGATLIDRFCDVSPTGEISMNHGIYRIKIETNWKMWIENSVDAYHVPTVHASNFYMSSMTDNKDLRKKTGNKGVFSVINSRDLGDGHSELDMRPQRRITGMTYTGEWSQGIPEAAQQKYLGDMEAFHGKEKAQQVLVDGPAHGVLFPNLFLILQELRWCVPVSVNETYLYYCPALLKGAPDEINTLRLRRDEGGYGPAGFQLADDIEVWARNYRGLQARGNEWVIMNRGLHADPVIDEEGVRAQDSLSEITMRSQWRHYRELMSAD